MTAKLEDRLLLRHAVAFDFTGLVDSCGLTVRVTMDAHEEGEWRLVKYDNDPYDRTWLLCESARGSDLFWIPWRWCGDVGEAWYPKTFESEREACMVALDICEERVKVRDSKLTKYGPDTVRLRAEVLRTAEFRNQHGLVVDPFEIESGLVFSVHNHPRAGLYECVGRGSLGGRYMDANPVPVPAAKVQITDEP